MKNYNKFLFLITLYCLVPTPTNSVQAKSDIPVFFVEGAPGVGKTTLLRLLEKNLPHVQVVYEPVEKFFNVNDQGNILGLFFTDLPRWALTTNLYITLMHAQALENTAIAPDTTAIIVDRSIYADYYIYGKLAHDQGLINSTEWAIYQIFFDYIEQQSSVKPVGFIYLQAPADIVLHRVKLRDNLDEKDLPVAWEDDQEKYHNAWFIKQQDISSAIAQTPTLIIDATENFKDDAIIQQKCIEQITNFMIDCTL